MSNDSKELIQSNTKILYAESPTNPAVDIIDLELLGVIAKKFGNKNKKY